MTLLKLEKCHCQPAVNERPGGSRSPPDCATVTVAASESVRPGDWDIMKMEDCLQWDYRDKDEHCTDIMKEHWQRR
jgi:hypothetical protein